MYSCSFVTAFNTKNLHISKIIRMFALQFKIGEVDSRLVYSRIATNLWSCLSPSIAELRSVSIKSRSTDRPNRAPHNGHGGKNRCELDV